VVNTRVCLAFIKQGCYDVLGDAVFEILIPEGVNSILKGVAGLLILGIVVRLLMGVMMRAALDSVLAVGILHQIFDASNNNGALVDSLLDGADAGNMTQLAAAVLTVLIVAWLLWRHPGAFTRRHTPFPDCPREVR
jgi:hypothetical protein